MSAEFDPYHKWLGIPRAEQPPNRYRLLGIKLFEDDADVIENAADQRMAHLRSFSAGRHGKLAQQLLNEIAAAKVDLLDPQRKAAYDEKVRRKQQKAMQDQSVQSPAVPPPAAVPQAPPAPVPVHAAPLPGESQPADPFSTASSLSSASRTNVRSRARARKKKSALYSQLAIGGGLALLLLAIFAVVIGSSSKDPPQDESKGKKARTGTSANQRVARAPTPSRQPPSRQPERSGSPTGKNPNNQPPKELFPTSPNETPGGQRPLPEAPLDEQPSDAEEKSDPEDSSPAAETPSLKFPQLEGEGGNSAVAEGGIDTGDAVDAGRARAEPPGRETQEKILQSLEQTFSFREAKTHEEKEALAGTLLDTARSTDNPDTKFVMLDQVRKLATEVGVVGLTVETLDTLRSQYQYDAIGAAAESLTQIRIPPERSDENGPLALAAGEWMERAAAADRYELAVALADTATGAARRAGNEELTRQMAAALQEYKNLQRKYRAIQAARERLENGDEDPRASSLVGEYLCFTKGDWSRGLPYLKNSHDEGLAQLAALELDDPTDPVLQAELADNWYDLSQQPRSEHAAAMRRRAGHWYRQAVSGLSGNEKARVEKRLAELSAGL